MKIEHIAIWVTDLEQSKKFFEKYFTAVANSKYHNKSTSFESYFLSFGDGCRLELMQRPDVTESDKDYKSQKLGIVHFAISVGTKEKVDEVTNLLRQDGYKIVGEPRTTGDGYYESVVLDPENNIIEITI
jgi:lactoylglutathione lyase